MVNLDEIRTLSVAERVQLVEDIWDTIEANADDLPLTDAQKVELDRRLALHERERLGRSWDEVKKSLESSH